MSWKYFVYGETNFISHRLLSTVKWCFISTVYFVSNCWIVEMLLGFFSRNANFRVPPAFFTCCRSPPHCCSPVKWSTEYSDQPSESAPIHCIERTLKHRNIPNGLRFLSSQYVLTLLQENVKFISSQCIFIIWSKE